MSLWSTTTTRTGGGGVMDETVVTVASTTTTTTPSRRRRTSMNDRGGTSYNQYYCIATTLLLIAMSSSSPPQQCSAFVPQARLSSTSLKVSTISAQVDEKPKAAAFIEKKANDNNNNKPPMKNDNDDNDESPRTGAPTNRKSRPIVVSEKAEALSHSDTTMKLIPSFDLFQLLTAEEGGRIPATCTGNALRDADVLKIGRPDTLAGLQLSDYEGLGGGTKSINTLPDPFKMVEQELKPFSDSIKELVSSDQPILSMAAKHFFEKRHGKRFRPTIVQLIAKAVAATMPEVQQQVQAAVVQQDDDDGDIDESTTLPSTTESNNNNYEQTGGVTGWQWSGASLININGDTCVTSDNHLNSDPWRKQAQLGQIVEMIHVASLIHDDVLDEAETRRGGEAVHKLYSNKVAVLAGDYLLARASVLLARLENTAVVQIMATALESLVAGEIMQLKSSPASLLEMETYLKKSYYKTASLICYACRSTALLGGHSYGSTVATACEEYGFHLGLAYQIQDDILDFTAAATVLGKPALADMDLGLSTAPILYAAQDFPTLLQPLIKRRFKNKGDKQIALEALYKSKNAMNKSRALARFHAQRAVDALLRLPQSDARDALVRLTHAVVTRSK